MRKISKICEFNCKLVKTVLQSQESILFDLHPNSVCIHEMTFVWVYESSMLYQPVKVVEPGRGRLLSKLITLNSDSFLGEANFTNGK